MPYDFKKKFDYQSRRSESSRIIAKYPDRIPVIVQRSIVKSSELLPDIDKHKYLVPSDLTVGQFVYVIRKRITLGAEKAMYIFCGDRGSVLPPSSSLMSNIYERHKDEDGFLYIMYTGENTFG